MDLQTKSCPLIHYRTTGEQAAASKNEIIRITTDKFKNFTVTLNLLVCNATRFICLNVAYP